MPGPWSSTASLTWDANSESDLSGYRIYWGTASGVYGNVEDVGNVTNGTVTIDASGTWYFAVTAYDTSNNESDFSSEISKSWLLLGNF